LDGRNVNDEQNKTETIITVESLVSTTTELQMIAEDGNLYTISKNFFEQKVGRVNEINLPFTITVVHCDSHVVSIKDIISG